MRSPLTGSSWRPSRGILPDLAAWQSVTLLAMCFHPKHSAVLPRFLSTCTRAATAATKEWRLHREVKWQIQVARRNINSFRTSEQQASCQREREREIKRAYPWYDRCIRDESKTVNFVCLSVGADVCLFCSISSVSLWKAPKSQPVKWLSIVFHSNKER